MKKEPILYGIIGLIVGSLLTAFVASNTVNNGYPGMMDNSSTVDAHFIEQMIPHHEDAITMSKLAQTKAKRPEIKQLANSIIDSQGREITQMRDWYKTWFGKDVPQDSQTMGQHGMMGMMGNDTDITKLEQSSDFDKAFIEQMIPHHQMAVMMAQMLENSTTRPEMQKLAEDIISAQTKEINQMRQWYQSWGY